MAVYDKDVVERYVMHLIALKGYPREKWSQLVEADNVYLWELGVDPDSVPPDVTGDTLYPAWNAYLDRYPVRNTDLSFSWEQFYSWPEDYRISVEDWWECEYGDDVESAKWLKPKAPDPDGMFWFLDDVMKYAWLRKHLPDGENRVSLDARRAAAKRRMAKTHTAMRVG